MSLFTTLDSDIPLSAIEEYDEGVFRTINSSFKFPYEREDIIMPYEFYFAENVNPLLHKLYENIEYLLGYSKLYNTLLPLETEACPEYLVEGSEVRSIKISDTHEATYTSTTVNIYKKGVLQETIEETQFGKFFDIRDIAFDGTSLYVLDERYLLKLDVNAAPFSFETFFGGLGSAASEYKFRDPVSIHIDTNGDVYVFDKGNQIIKRYNSYLSFVENIPTTSATGIDVYNGVVYETTNTTLRYGDVVFQHGLESADKILIDRTQEGFFWVGSGTRLKKFAFNGLEIYDQERVSLDSLERMNTSLVVVDEGAVSREIEYQFTTTILSGEELLHPVSAIEIDPNEFITDIVVNDSIYKLYETLDDFNQRIVGEFTAVLDAESSYVSVGVEPVSGYDIELNDQLFHRHDELISCHAWDRTVATFFSMLETTRDRLFGIDTFVDGVGGGGGEPIDPVEFFEGISWSLGSQSCEGIPPQLFNPNFTPISFEELDSPSLSCLPLTSLDCIEDDG